MWLSKLSGIKLTIDLVYVQRVRLFLGVMTLADISSSDGKTLCKWALSVNENPRKPVFRSPTSRTTTSIKHNRNQEKDYTNVLHTR
jgi:hypothetical protein